MSTTGSNARNNAQNRGKPITVNPKNFAPDVGDLDFDFDPFAGTTQTYDPKAKVVDSTPQARGRFDFDANEIRGQEDNKKREPVERGSRSSVQFFDPKAAAAKKREDDAARLAEARRAKAERQQAAAAIAPQAIAAGEPQAVQTNGQAMVDQVGPGDLKTMFQEDGGLGSTEEAEAIQREANERREAAGRPKQPAKQQVVTDRENLDQLSIDDGGLGPSVEAEALQAEANAGRAQTPDAPTEQKAFSDVFDRLKTGKVVAFTGHRNVDKDKNEKLPSGWAESGPEFARMKDKLRDAALFAYHSGARTFLTGMALGSDMIAAEVMLDLKKTYGDIVIIGAVPFPGQDDIFIPKSKKRYAEILSQIAWGYTADVKPPKFGDMVKAMHHRNGEMVDRAGLVIALYDGEGTGGTANAVARAKHFDKPIIVIDPMSADVTYQKSGEEKPVDISAMAQRAQKSAEDDDYDNAEVPEDSAVDNEPLLSEEPTAEDEDRGIDDGFEGEGGIPSWWRIDGHPAMKYGPNGPGIYGFQSDEFRWLSNFFPAEVSAYGEKFPSTEYLYQASKATDPSEREQFHSGGPYDLPAGRPKVDPKTGGITRSWHNASVKAKRMGKKNVKSFDRARWNQNEYQVMQIAVERKFRDHPELAQKLLDTGELYLEETNNHGDDKWGVIEYTGEGTNWLGEILMETRRKLRAGEPLGEPVVLGKAAKPAPEEVAEDTAPAEPARDFDSINFDEQQGNVTGNIEDDVMMYSLNVYDWLKSLDYFFYDTPEAMLEDAVSRADSSDNAEFNEKYKSEPRLKSLLEEEHQKLLDEARRMFAEAEENTGRGIVEQYFLLAENEARALEPSSFDSYEDYAKAAINAVWEAMGTDYLRMVYDADPAFREKEESDFLDKVKSMWQYAQDNPTESPQPESSPDPIQDEDTYDPGWREGKRFDFESGFTPEPEVNEDAGGQNNFNENFVGEDPFAQDDRFVGEEPFIGDEEAGEAPPFEPPTQQKEAQTVEESLISNASILPELIEVDPAARAMIIRDAVIDNEELKARLGLDDLGEDFKSQAHRDTAEKIRSGAAERDVERTASSEVWEILDTLSRFAGLAQETSDPDDKLAYLAVREMLMPGLALNAWRYRVMHTAMSRDYVPTAALDIPAAQELMDGLVSAIDDDVDRGAKLRNNREWYRNNADASTPGNPQPKMWDRMVHKAIQVINDMYYGDLPLSGDITEQRVRYENRADGTRVPVTVTVNNARSQVVYDGMSVALKKFGFGDIDPLDHDELDKHGRYLSRAFMVYRGMSRDMRDLVFRQKQDSYSVMDEEFLLALEEMAFNVRPKTDTDPGGTGYIFTYHPKSVLARTLAFTLPIDRDLAVYFTRNSGEGTSNPNGLSVEDMIDYGINQHNNIVQKRINLLGNKDQKIVLQMMLHAIVMNNPEMAGADPSVTEAGRPTLTALRPEQFRLLSEMLDVTSTWARANTEENDLLRVSAEQDERYVASLAHMTEVNKRWDSRNIVTKNVHEFFEFLSGIAFFNKLFLLGHGAAAVLGIVEREDNLLRSSRVAKSMAKSVSKKVGYDVAPSEEALDRVSESDCVAAGKDFLKFMNSPDHAFLLNVVAMNPRTKFGSGEFERASAKHEKRKKSGDPEERVKAGVEAFISAGSAGVRKASDVALSMSSGDFVGNKKLMRTWMRYYFMLMAEAQLHGRVAVDPATLEATLMNNPDDFFRAAFASVEGQAAMSYAMNGMLSGYNIATAAIGESLRNPVARYFVGFATTFFPKFQTNAMLRLLPFSAALTHMAKFGINQHVMKKAAATGDPEAIAMASGWVNATNALQVGGMNLNTDRVNYLSEAEANKFWVGLQECLLVDGINMGFNASYAMVLLLAIVASGIEPPDDELLYSDYREYRIGTNIRPGGWLIKESWVLDDILRFSMPAAVGFAVMIKSDDWTSEGKWTNEDSNIGWKVFGYGAADVVLRNRWTQLMGLTDFANTVVFGYEHELTMNEDADLEQGDVFLANVRSFMIRNSVSLFEPVFLREESNGGGWFSSGDELDVSSTQVYTKSNEDDPSATTQTTYMDARLRRDTKNSPLAAWFANKADGILSGTNTDQKTGYGRDDRPLVSNVDPVNQMWVDRLGPQTPEGTFIEFEPTNEEVLNLYAPIAEEVRGIIENEDHTPQILASSGLVLPYNARKALSFQYDLEIELMEREYYARKANGDWINHDKYGSPEHIRLAQEQNAAYEKIEKRKKEVYALKEKLWSNSIPYAPRKLNRGMTDFREIHVWAEGTPKAGQVAAPWEAIWNQDVETRLYPVGNNKSSWKLWTVVQDDDERSYDSRTKLGWNNEMTDEDFVRSTTTGYIVVNGIGKGKDLYSLVTGDGATGPGATKSGAWDPNEFLFMFRGYYNEEITYAEMEVPEFDWDEILGKDPNEDKEAAEVPNANNNASWGNWGSGWGGSSSYVQDIYSHAAGNLNADKPSNLYTKSPSYIRFDYLRPSVQTKGSRQAYRREDF